MSEAENSLHEVNVYVTTKEGVPNPYVPAMTSDLHELGFTNATVLAVGQTVRLTIDAENGNAAEEVARKAAETLLANPVHQEFEVSEAKPSSLPL